jgi:hypothetical protein
MPAYSVIGWQVSGVDIVHAEARDAFEAARAAFVLRWRERPDTRFVAVFAGKLRAAATWPPAAERRSPARRMVGYTVVGFWRHSGETYSRPILAGSAVEALALAQGRTASEEELQLVLAFDGRLVAAVTAETLPLEIVFAGRGRA